MVVIEIIILEISRIPLEEPLAISTSTRRIEIASTCLRSLLDVGEKPEVVAYFAPIRRDVEQGRGELQGKGQDLLAQDKRRRQELSELFTAARGQLAAGQWSAATSSLRTIQESVVFFRDLLKQVLPLP
jgi:hypothetical protein